MLTSTYKKSTHTHTQTHTQALFGWCEVVAHRHMQRACLMRALDGRCLRFLRAALAALQTHACYARATRTAVTSLLTRTATGERERICYVVVRHRQSTGEALLLMGAAASCADTSGISAAGAGAGAEAGGEGVGGLCACDLNAPGGSAPIYWWGICQLVAKADPSLWLTRV